MKYCTKCGNAIDDNAAVCPICGETQKKEGSQNQSGTYSDFHSVKEKGPVGTAIASFIIGITQGSLFDATQTMVNQIGDDLYEVQTVSWYDNENSYTSQMVRTIKYFSELG